MRILVLGSHGFIGRHLAAGLATAGEILTADIVETNEAGYWRIDAEAPAFDDLLAATRPDVVINCTGAANVSASIESPGWDFFLNSQLLQRLLDAGRRVSPDARFVHFSSAAVYGNPGSLPIAESAEISPLSPYGFHKWIGELLCREYSQIFGLKTLSLRVFSAFGPGLRKQIFWDVYQKARGSDRIELGGTGQESRDFIFVSDISLAVSSILRSTLPFDGGAVNVASGKEVTIETAVSTLLDKLGWQGELAFSKRTRPGDPLHWRAGIDRLASTGFSPRVDLETGLTQVARWLSEQ